MKISPHYKNQTHCFHTAFHQSCIIIFVLIVFLACSCNDSTTGSEDNPPDTTSHSFRWRLDTIGTTSSYLLDVTIIDENDIWAVGKIHTDETGRLDSLGNWIQPFNATHWDGEKWELLRLPVRTSYDSITYGPINTAFALNDTNIWMFARAGSYIHWDGQSWTTQFVSERQGAISRIWGTSANNLYFVGTNGNITRFDGQLWQKLNSKTDLDIQDIWGAYRRWNGTYEVLALASNRFLNQDLTVLRIDGPHVSVIDTTGLRLSQSGIWFDPSKSYYIAGDGLFAKKTIGDAKWQEASNFPLVYQQAVRGNSWNDVFVVGDFGLVSHFSGLTWKHYMGTELPQLNGKWHNLSVRGDVVCAVGELANNQGVILQGWRQK